MKRRTCSQGWVGFQVLRTELGAGTPTPTPPQTPGTQRTIPTPCSFSVLKTFRIEEAKMAKWIPTLLAVMEREGAGAPGELGVS